MASLNIKIIALGVIYTLISITKQQCTIGADNCTSCNGAACDACDTNYTVTLGKCCPTSTLPNCVSCDHTGCLACGTGSSKNGNACVSCSDPNCQFCSSPNHCATCV